MTKLLSQEISSYEGGPFFLRNGHVQTFYPGIFKRFPPSDYERERLELADGDFLDLDWLKGGNGKLLVLTHGLEGSSQSHYIREMGQYFIQNGYDVLAWNCRSCSGEMNRARKMYHHGDIEDISIVMNHVNIQSYQDVFLAGFSMGANITLKYLGTNPEANIKGAIAFSAPCHLAASAKALDVPGNWMYKKLFQKGLLDKIKIKKELYADYPDPALIKDVVTWRDFDELFTAPINGFSGADEFYYQGSAANFMDGIEVPTLIVNALNDPLLPEACHPYDICKKKLNLKLETPAFGGHLGFTQKGRKYSYMVKRSDAFFTEI